MINPPTDNLYKFCAIVGVFLIVFNTYYSYELRMKNKNDLINLIGEEEKNNVEFRHFKLDFEKYKGSVQKVLDEKDSLSSEIRTYRLQLNQMNKKDIKDLEERIKVIKDTHSKLDKIVDSLNNIMYNKTKDLTLDFIEIDTKEKIINNQKKKIDHYFVFMIIGLIVGLTLSSYGFYNWSKLQKKLDNELN